MNETIRSILNRRSIRSYQDQPVEQDKIDLLIECAKYAPSGMNAQPWHFTVVTNRKALDKITEENRKFMLASPDLEAQAKAKDPSFDSFRGAPAAIIASGMGRFGESNCANAVENMAVAAYSLGLGSCYLASFKNCYETPAGKQFFHEDLCIPEGYTPYFALAVGYGNEVLGDRAPRRGNTVTIIK